MSNEFDDDLHIDLHTLDLEWQNQAPLYRKYSDMWAEAKGVVDSLKNRLDRTYATLFVRVKESPSEFTDAKMTEELAKSLVLTQDEYIKIQDEYNEAVEELNLLYSARIAFEHRKSALEHLTRLFLSNYWAEVKVPNDEREGYKEHLNRESRKDFSEEVTGTLKKRRLKKSK